MILPHLDLDEKLLELKDWAEQKGLALAVRCLRYLDNDILFSFFEVFL